VSHLVHAAAVLVSQVGTLRPEATWETSGEPDGYQRIRSIEFDPDTSAWLRPILEAISDPRIDEFTLDNQMIVTFVGDVRADLRDPYPLTLVAKVLYD
jgi:hypothetical protein